jgi:small-conductance mechanosensitive channel
LPAANLGGMADADWVEWLRFTVDKWTVPVCILGGVIIVASFAERILHARLVRWAQSAQWKGAEVIAFAARGMAFLWLTMVGVVIAAANAPISDANRTIVENVMRVLWVLSGTSVVARAIAGFITVQLRSLPGLGSTSILTNVTSLVVYAVGALIACQTLGLNIAPALGALGVGGLAVALALQDTLSNLFAGIHILIVRQVRIGDWVRLDSGDEGAVVDIGWRNTTIRTLLNNLVVIPNAKLAGAVVTNFSLPEKNLVIKVQVGVAYDSDLPKVERVTLEVARSVLPAAGDAKLDPVVRFHTLADWSINLDVHLPIPDFQEQNAVKHRFIVALVERYRAENIEIPFPSQVQLSPRGGFVEVVKSAPGAKL